MGLRSFISGAARLLRLAKKPGRSELWLSVKICMLGVAVVGVVGFIIKFISGLMQGFGA